MLQTGHLTLGRLAQPEDPSISEPFHYPLAHLTTHALLLGATGSGKTGLGIVVVEEILRQGIPVLLLDVKGDLSNLLLTFPDLAPADFAPWIDEETAHREGKSQEEAAAGVAQQWQTALEPWGLGTEQIAALRNNVEISLYTPGLRPGRPIDILSHFGSPPQDPNESAIRAQGLASALLGLAGIEADPLQSREHILMTTLIQHRWASQEPLDIPNLIQMVQYPPIEQVGVFDMESFFPQKERFTLALTLNNLIAAPGFALWREGDPLDIDHFLRTPEGKPRASIFYLAHLPEEQRRFFVTLFLEELRTWVRQQGGTKTLRALLVFDEIYGYLPPHPYNPPTKVPLLALVKQGRAAGLGVLLSTQNPADIDYKGLSNIGTWFVGTLRTERDRDRILEAMEGTLSNAGIPVKEVERSLSSLQPRTFLAHDARDGVVKFFQSRWAMSYLRGPLTTAEVQGLALPTDTATPSPTALRAHLHPAPLLPEAPSLPVSLDLLKQPPPLAPDVPQAFLPPTTIASWAIRAHRERTGEPISSSAGAILIYRPYLLGVAFIHLNYNKTNLNLTDQQVWRVPAQDEHWAMHWEGGEMIALHMEDLTSAPPEQGYFDPLPGALGDKSAYTRWEAALKSYLYHNTQLQLWECPPLKIQSHPGENKPTFLRTCQHQMERGKAAEIEGEKETFAQQAAKIEAKRHREALELDQDRQELSERKREEFLSGAETILGLFSKRTSPRALSQTSRQRRYVQKAESDVEESLQSLKHYNEQLEELQEAWKAREREITQKWEAMLSQIQAITVRPKKQDIEIRFCGLAWFPFWSVTHEQQQRLLPAYIPQGS